MGILNVMKWMVAPALLIITVWWVLKAEHSTSFQIDSNRPRFAYHMSHCHLPQLDAWDKSILRHVEKKKIPHCEWTSQLTYTEGAWLKVNKSVLSTTYNVTSCGYQSVTRKQNTDNRAVLSKVMPFELKSGVMINDEFIKVSCYTGNTSNPLLIYRNYHALVLDRSTAQHVTLKTNKNKTMASNMSDHYNVILIGTDSMSQSAGVRYFPNTRAFLLDKLNAVELLGYTKVGLNTFPNMVPFTTGYHIKELEGTIPGYNGPYDNLPLIFKNYSAAGYKTFFAEDSPGTGMFNYLAKGFKKPPTDYYYRPLSLLVQGERNFTYKGCEKPITMSRMIADYLRRFVTKFQNQRFFALMFLSQLSHDYQGESRRLDQIYIELMSQLQQQGVWKKTFLLFFGDHGARWGGLMGTDVGRMEGKLPMMYVAVPKTFKHKHPLCVDNLKHNSKRLTTAFDAHETLLSILELRNGSSEGKHGLSLFSKVPKFRTCDDAGIPLSFCICYRQGKIDVKNSAVHQGALFLVNEINGILTESLESKSRCAKLKLHNISSASEFKIISGAEFMYNIVFSTRPGYGKFEGLVQFNKDLHNKLSSTDITEAQLNYAFARRGPTTRLNKYGNQSICVTNKQHRLYCYCMGK